MLAGWRVAHVGPCREITVLVLKHAIQDDELFPAGVGVGRERTAGRIADDGCRASYLAADAVQHAPVHAFHRRGLPFNCVGIDDNAGGEISVQFHGGS